MKHRLLALAAAGALCLSLCGFSGEQPLPDTITVQGTGLVEARPDQTEFSAGVRVTSPTAAAAVAAGSEQAAAVRQALERYGCGHNTPTPMKPGSATASSTGWNSRCRCRRG